MKTIMKSVVAGTAALVLSGCASQWDVDSVAATQPTGSAFAQALHKHYVDRAKFERSEQDWSSVEVFVDRARTAAAGTAPPPMRAADWGLGGAADLDAAHDRLVAALATNAPQVAPDACARAQTWFEHWSEQRAEGHQADHIATAKAAYDAAIVDCVPTKAVAAPAPAPEPMAQPKSFIVHFPFDSAALVDGAMSVLRDVAGFFKAEDMKRAEVVAHTDTAGPDAYNDALSERRAAAVKGALTDLGVPGTAVSTASKGEADPAVVRGDGVPEQRNRRAEIIVRP